METWKKEVIEILKSLNGHAYLKDIYQEFEIRNPDRINSNYQASTRDALEKGSKDSVNLEVKNYFTWLME